MKVLKKISFMKFASTLIMFLNMLELKAQVDPGGTDAPPPPPGAPIDSNIMFLLTIGLVIAGVYYYNLNKNKSKL
ncbi:hypothetical protein FB1_22410 [Flavobacterium branchiophilum NBRC 15030 = ATCC 35035]|uniref:Uncharacterized protein n=2 Tax=Flavobacterium branchiophilum TaxID=55197 RepID=A0A543G1Y7_9FLAO|nr:hypothetical protein BC670_0917 [Flavobacterium branchiophilum]GEM56020.1 hypothetical protein FB1_22410 [Flavobacterium branchiophilum NBRC 15030 = ATCC 35035]